MSVTAIYDIETDGFLDKLTQIHSLCIKIHETGEVISCTNSAPPGGKKYRTIEEGLAILAEADLRVGQNIIKFDEEAIRKVYPGWTPKGRIFDTLNIARLVWPDVKEKDFARRRALKKKHRSMAKVNELFPGSIIGRHSLEAWGIRLGEWKGDYQKIKAQELKDQFHAEHMKYREMGLLVKDCPPKVPTKEQIGDYVWGTWNVEMQDYCEQDIEVTEKLYNLILGKNYSTEAIDLELDFAIILRRMEREGFPFDLEGARRLTDELTRRLLQIGIELQKAFPPWVERTPFIPKVNNATLGYVKGVQTFKEKTIEFNPGSRDHIADRLTAKYGWKPTEFTDTGKPKIDEDVLKGLTYPETDLLVESMLIQKRLGTIAEGKNAWLRHVTEAGRIHHEVTTNGAVTGRCTHSKPNVAQTPSATIVEVKKGGKFPQCYETLHVLEDGTHVVAVLGRDGGWGSECRRLWGPPPGMVQVGADLSGLELRCLAHYMHTWDQGAYTKELLEGDIHTANQLAAGLPTRGDAKTFIYGFLYGAGDEKVGQIVGAGKARGKELKKTFLERTPALNALRKMVERLCAPYIWEKTTVLKDGKPKVVSRKVENKKYRGYLVGLDGRHLPIRSPHAALNTLLQSAGALISKKATVLLYERLTGEGFKFHEDWAMMAHVHDEVQLWARPEDAEYIGKVCVWAFEEAGKHFDFKCPITGEYKIGGSWLECH